MSKKNNVNPDHYKTGGRTYKGEEIVRSIHKRNPERRASARRKTRRASGKGAEAVGRETRDKRRERVLHG